jgi:hypothetical protein
MFQKLLGSQPNFARLKFLIALTLADLASIVSFAPRYQIYSALDLPSGPVDFARADALLALEEVSAELLKRVRIELVKWDWLAWVETKWHRWSETSIWPAREQRDILRNSSVIGQSKRRLVIRRSDTLKYDPM